MLDTIAGQMIAVAVSLETVSLLTMLLCCDTCKQCVYEMMCDTFIFHPTIKVIDIYHFI